MKCSRLRCQVEHKMHDVRMACSQDEQQSAVWVKSQLVVPGKVRYHNRLGRTTLSMSWSLGWKQRAVWLKAACTNRGDWACRPACRLVMPSTSMSTACPHSIMSASRTTHRSLDTSSANDCTQSGCPGQRDVMPSSRVGKVSLTGHDCL